MNKCLGFLKIYFGIFSFFLLIFFFYQGFLSRTLTTHIYWQLYRWDDYQTITYFQLQRLYLPDCYSMRFTNLSNYYLIDWCDVYFRFRSFVIFDLILGFVTAMTRTRINYHPCVITEPTNPVRSLLNRVGCFVTWVTWVRALRGSNILHGSNFFFRGSKRFSRVQNFCVGQFFLFFFALVNSYLLGEIILLYYN